MEASQSSSRSGAVLTQSSSQLPISSPPLPPRPPAKSETLSLLLDPLLELCPSLHSIQSLCLLPVSSLPDKDESFRRKRLERAILRAASNGDTELLSWICYVKSRKGNEDTCPEAKAFEGFEWGDIRDDEGTGPLNLAASSGHAEIVQMLVQHGADVDERDASGWTPLMWATNCSNLPLVSFLLSHGANVEAKSIKGATCEDFIISSTPDTGFPSSSSSSSSSSALPRSNTLSPSPNIKVPLSPHSSDRQLIADLVFEHQQAMIKEKAMKINGSHRQHLRNLSSSSSQMSVGNDSLTSSSLAPPHSISSSSMAQSSPSKSLHSRNSSMTLRRIIGRTERTQLAEAELRARELAEGRRRALLEVAVMLQVDYSDLIGEPPIPDQPSDNTSGIDKRRARMKEAARRGKSVHSGLASGCGAVEVGADPLSMEFDFNTVRPDQMLVLGENEVVPLLNKLINEAKPLRAPWVIRSKPANVLYMCIRYACHLSDEELLEEILFGAVDRIEANLYAHPTEMTHLAYWLYNSMLLLHYLQRDKTLQRSESLQDYQSLVADLINEIYVFIVRDMERRIDKVLDAAILDYNPIPGSDDVRFEGEWSFMKTLTGSVKRASQSNQASPAAKKPLSQLFSSSDSASSSPRAPSTPISSAKRESFQPSIAITPSSSSMADLREPSHAASASDLLAKPMPRTITLLLTSTLHILQLYEVNPCVIVQALSQVFFWVGCELFNRVISQRKYLYKSKAMQIRLNISALEDWVRTNALPLSIVNQHLSKLNQLVSWLLCQSSLTELDGMILTMQGLKDLHPSQLKKVVKDYRYEVGETRIHVDCLEYLDQIQVDWEKRREQEKLNEESERHGHSRSGTATQSQPSGRRQRVWEGSEDDVDEDDQYDNDHNDEKGVGMHGVLDKADQLGIIRDKTSSLTLDDDTMDSSTTETDIKQTESEAEESRRARATQQAIDRLFQSGQSMTSYIPPQSSLPTNDTNQSIFLNSRDMLPFALPSQTHTLIVSPGDAFGFGRGHFMGTGTPSLKSFRNESLLGSHSIPGSPAISSSASSETSSRASSTRMSDVSNGTRDSRLYPQGKGLAAGSYWQPVPLLPEDTLEEIQTLMRRVELEVRYNGGNTSRRPSVDSRLSEAATAAAVTASSNKSPTISTTTTFLNKSPIFDSISSSPSPSAPFTNNLLLSPQFHSPSIPSPSSSTPIV